MDACDGEIELNDPELTPPPPRAGGTTGDETMKESEKLRRKLASEPAGESLNQTMIDRSLSRLVLAEDRQEQAQVDLALAVRQEWTYWFGDD